MVDLFDKGYDAGKVLRAIGRTGEPDIGRALLQLAEARPDVSRASGFQGAELIGDV